MALPLDVTGWTEPEVQELFASAKASLTSGQLVSWSSAGNSATRQVFQGESPSEVMRWCQWALRELNPTVYGYNRTRTVATFSNLPYKPSESNGI
jgi:hypothetical protein